MTGDWPWALLLLLIAPAVGSFLGVLVDRLTARQSPMTGRSRCASCATMLSARDLAPILSFVALQGKCRHCGADIPGYLLRIEIAALLAGFLAVLLVPDTMEMWLTALFLWCLIALFYCDLLHFRLPDHLTLALLVIGLAMAWHDPVRGLADGAISAAAGLAAFWLIRWSYFQWRRTEGLGLGDVKLIAGIGAAIGWHLLPWVVLIASLLALVVASLRSIGMKSLPKADTKLPFGSFLAAAATIVVLV